MNIYIYFLIIYINIFLQGQEKGWGCILLLMDIAALEGRVARLNKATANRSIGFQRLTSLGILKPLLTSQHFIILRCFRGVLNWIPMMPRDASLSDSCTSDRCCFSSP